MPNTRWRYDAPRRALYLPIIRNAMFELFVAFDYADPSVHLEQRPQSAVAPQALYMLNAPFVRQQSKALAEELLQRGAAHAKLRAMQDLSSTRWLGSLSVVPSR